MAHELMGGVAGSGASATGGGAGQRLQAGELAQLRRAGLTVTVQQARSSTEQAGTRQLDRPPGQAAIHFC
jgi:hypothetical protein